MLLDIPMYSVGEFWNKVHVAVINEVQEDPDSFALDMIRGHYSAFTEDMDSVDGVCAVVEHIFMEYETDLPNTYLVIDKMGDAVLVNYSTKLILTKKNLSELEA